MYWRISILFETTFKLVIQIAITFRDSYKITQHEQRKKRKVALKTPTVSTNNNLFVVRLSAHMNVFNDDKPP